MAMQCIDNEFDTGSRSFMHDIAYDYYGKRLAVCSSKECITIFRQSLVDGNPDHWEREPNGRLEHKGSTGHKGPVVKLAWAHPEFGSIIASCSKDHKVIIWKEEVGSGASNVEWQLKTELVDAREEVTDVKFAPHHMGLKLALCSKDGFVRIYEAPDVMQPDHWDPVHEFEAGGQEGLAQVMCIAWNPSRFDTPMLLVGLKSRGDERSSVATTIKVWSFSENHRRWQPLTILEGEDAPTQTVLDVAWAPNVGRRYHLLAACSADDKDDKKHLRIWKIPGGKKMFDAEDEQRETFVTGDGNQAQRISWNVTGTILASTGDAGEVQLWTMDHFTREWTIHHSISPLQ